MRPMPALREVSERDGVEREVELCAFRVGDSLYAVDIHRVEEILPVRKTTPFPNAPAFVEGAVQLRSELLPVVSLRKRLGVAEGATEGGEKASGDAPKRRSRRHDPKLMVCWIGRRKVAFRVDGMAGVFRSKLSEIRPPPPLLGSAARKWVVGVCRGREALTLLLDVKALFEEVGG